MFNWQLSLNIQEWSRKFPCASLHSQHVKVQLHASHSFVPLVYTSLPLLLYPAVRHTKQQRKFIRQYHLKTKTYYTDVASART